MTAYTRTPYVSRKGFSLLELIIVVLIVSLIGFLTFSSAIKEQQKVEVLNPTTLASTFRESFKGQGDVELFCINEFAECHVMQGSNITPYEGGINFGENVEVYLLDEDNHLTKVEDFGRIDDQKVSFRYHLYPNGSTTQIVISNDEGIYYLPSYFGEAKKVEDIEEAKELWMKEEYSLRDSGSFY